MSRCRVRTRIRPVPTEFSTQIIRSASCIFCTECLASPLRTGQGKTSKSGQFTYSEKHEDWPHEEEQVHRRIEGLCPGAGGDRSGSRRSAASSGLCRPVLHLWTASGLQAACQGGGELRISIRRQPRKGRAKNGKSAHRRLNNWPVSRNRYKTQVPSVMGSTAHFISDPLAIVLFG